MKNEMTEEKLPELPVMREAYCNQKMTDTLVRFLEKHELESFAYFQSEIVAGYPSSYMGEVEEMLSYIENVASNHVDVPNSKLGKVDFIFEVMRRARKKYGIVGTELPGNPLVEKEGQPLPPFPPITPDIYAGMKNMTQEIVERILPVIYQRRPELIYELSEAVRRQLVIGDITQDFHSILEILGKEMDVPPKGPHWVQLQSSMSNQLKKIMGIKGN